ncbi:MAG: T9SS type A sorting domain-containing protein [Sphingobacteriales bacterium]|nr:T9SS type A sorting domain-containing protein [Sphingobacteriales bacterium]
MQTDDGGFAISYMKTTLPESYSGLLKLNADRTIAWNSDSSFYASSPAEKIIHIANEGYLFAGEYETDPVLLNNLDAEIVRLSANGDILWKRHYGGMDNDYIYDFIPTSDGGYFFVGRTESPDLGVPTGGANVYLLKTNCMGLLTEPQANFTAQIDTALLTATFQNLSQYTYPDSIDGGHYLWDFGDGTTSTQINPTHTYAQGGNYSVTLTAVVCSDTSVFVQQVSTWAVGIEASPLPPPKEEEIRVLPNPANEQISISPPSGGWGVQTHTFVLYDVLGKEVASQVLLANGTSVKTQHLPSGIYLYQIINPQNQTLQHGKLSILH